MKFHLLGLALASLVLYSGCASGKLTELFQEGGVSPASFRVELPFEDRAGLLIVPVEIGGKTRQFLLDTGAPNIITTALARELGLTSLVQFSVKDIHGRARKLPFTQIDSLTLGGLTFYQTAAIISDLDVSPEMRCLGVDGFIGSNLLSHTFLQIDYVAGKVVLASSADSLQLDEERIEWPFQTGIQQTPLVDLRVGAHTFSSLTLDTGSSGWVDLPGEDYWKVRATVPIAGRRSFGISSGGLYGDSDADTIYRTWVPEVHVSETATLPGVSIDFSNSGNQIIGNKFLRHFRLTVDWKSSMAYLEPRDTLIPAMRSFGFQPFFREGQLQVGLVWEGSSAHQAGLQTGDRILFMNGRDYINFTEQDYCRFLLNDVLQDLETLDLVIEHEGATMMAKLKRENFFQ